MKLTSILPSCLLMEIFVLSCIDSYSWKNRVSPLISDELGGWVSRFAVWKITLSIIQYSKQDQSFVNPIECQMKYRVSNNYLF
jgi:hypothetical protein